jgi:hypothetical protein
MKIQTAFLFVYLALGTTTLAANPQLEGIWLRPCRSGSIQVQEFSDNQSYVTELFFVDANCKTPMMAFMDDGTFNTDQQNIDFQFQKVSVSLYTDELVADYNLRAVCGIKTWQKNSPQEITGLQCAIFQASKLVQIPRVGDMRYGIWKVDLDKLYFGQLSKINNGQTPETRPTIWDPNSYVKQ